MDHIKNGRGKKLVEDIKKDYSHLNTKKNGYIWNLLFSVSFKMCFWFRVLKHLTAKNFALYKPFVIIIKLYYKHLEYKYGISLPVNTTIGGGLCIKHFSCIVFSPKCIIGEDFTIHQGVTIGKVHHGRNEGYPTIGNNVVAYAGCKILGNIKIGNNVEIGANSVVTHDVPDNAIVAGVPARILRIKND